MLKVHSRQAPSVVAGLMVLGLMLGPAAPSSAGLVPGGGKATSDCYSEFDVAGVDSTSNTIECNDGDACDSDGLPNGVCDFKIALCPNQTDPNVSGCTPHPPLTALKIKGKPKSLTLPTAPADLTGTTCGDSADVMVPIKVTKKGKKKTGKATILVKATSSGSPKNDPDKLILHCNPGGMIKVACGKNPQGGPDEIDLSTADAGSDLDNGWTGISHNFPTPPRSSVKLCLTGCDASTNPVCDASGDTGAGSLNGATFGPPLPLIAQSVPVCVINRYQPGPLTGKMNIQTGEVPPDSPVAVNLFSDVHLTLTNQVCPRCKGSGAPQFAGKGTCDGGANVNQACTIDSILNVVGAQGSPVYALSKDCPPEPGQLAGTLNIQLRLTTGTSTLAGPTPCKEGQNNPNAAPLKDDNCNGSACNGMCTGAACSSHTADGKCVDAKGGLSQLCCNSSSVTPCFPTSAASAAAGLGSIVRTGSPDPPAPVWPDTTYPKTSTKGILVTTFCEAPTNKSVINATAGLPGPGALILPGSQELLKQP